MRGDHPIAGGGAELSREGPAPLRRLSVAAKRSLPVKHEVHNPAPTHMRSLAAAVSDYLLLLTARVHEGIGKNRHALEGLVVVDGLCEANDVGSSPPRVEGHGAEG